MLQDIHDNEVSEVPVAQLKQTSRLFLTEIEVLASTLCDHLQLEAKEAAEIDVSTVKKSRAASPAPKGKEKEGKEMMASSPSAEKASKVEKKPEPAKTEKVENHFGDVEGNCGMILIRRDVFACFSHQPSKLGLQVGAL